VVALLVPTAFCKMMAVPLRKPVTNACALVSDPAKLENSPLKRVDSWLVVVADVLVAEVVVLCAITGVMVSAASTAEQTRVSVKYWVFMDNSCGMPQRRIAWNNKQQRG
jgi:hypothetical protein